jgi:phosphoglycolate phosphatase
VLLGLERLACAPSAALFVGDSPYDMQAARAAGVHALGVAWGAFTVRTLYDAGAESILQHPTELLPYIRRFESIPAA